MLIHTPATPRPQLVRLGVALATAVLSYKTIERIWRALSYRGYSVSELIQDRHLPLYIYSIVLCIALILSDVIARRAGLVGALVARAGWLQGLVMSAVLSLITLAQLFEGQSTPVGALPSWLSMGTGFGLALYFSTPIALDQTPLRIIPVKLRSAIALSSIVMFAELNAMIFYVIASSWDTTHLILLIISGSIITAFIGITRGHRWGFALHITNLALMGGIAIAQLLGWSTPLGSAAPLLLLSLIVQAIPYIAMLRGALWREDARHGAD